MATGPVQTKIGWFSASSDLAVAKCPESLHESF
jgi:hypothetical protein